MPRRGSLNEGRSLNPGDTRESKRPLAVVRQRSTKAGA